MLRRVGSSVFSMASFVRAFKSSPSLVRLKVRLSLYGRRDLASLLHLLRLLGFVLNCGAISLKLVF